MIGVRANGFDVAAGARIAFQRRFQQTVDLLPIVSHVLYLTGLATSTVTRSSSTRIPPRALITYPELGPFYQGRPG